MRSSSNFSVKESTAIIYKKRRVAFLEKRLSPPFQEQIKPKHSNKGVDYQQSA